MKHKLLLLLIVLSITGCSLQELRHEERPTTSRAFGVEEAKEFFEKDYMGLLTRSQDSGIQRKSFKGKLHPGDFTPLWDKAVYSESDGVAAYDVDILADRSIIAIRSKFGPSGAKAERLKVYQKLVVRRNVQSGKMASYVLSLIPDVGCDDRRIPEKFRSRGEKGNFSGLAVYTTTDRGALVRVQEYKDGVLQRGVYIPSGKGSYADRCRKAREILDGTALMSRRNIMTRSGEDYWEDSWDDNDYSDLDINDLEDLGEGVYTDGNGHYYIDIDYDGDIDLETIAPGHVEEEMPEEPDIPDTPEPKPDPEPDTGDGNDDEFPENDLPTGDEEIDEEMVALGREGVEKIAADLESGNVNVYQYLNGALTGLGVGTNANGIITSAANFVREIASDHLFQAFGKSISRAGIICGLGQTILAVREGEEFSTGDWLNIVSTALGAAALFPVSFPISGVLGVTSGIIGIISSLVSDLDPGLYIFETPDGDILYVFISGTIV